MPLIILENIRSAYNVGNIVRSADVLGRDVAVSGYTPSPLHNPKVQKTSLNAQHYVRVKEFTKPQQALDYARTQGYRIVAAEITPDAVALDQVVRTGQDFAVVLGNEVTGVEPETLAFVDEVVMIPLQGSKDSLNVGQAGAIFMRALGKR